jgi:hypothetical protein
MTGAERQGYDRNGIALWLIREPHRNAQRADVVSERRANDNDPKAKGYELGDLQIVPTRRSSGAHPAVQASSVPAPSAPSASAAGAKPRGVRNLTLADGDMGPALELDTGALSPAAAARASLAERRAQPPRAPTPPAARVSATNSVPSGSAAAALDNFGASALDDFDEGFAQLPQLEVEKVERRSGDRVAAKEPVVDEALENERKEAEAVQALARFNAAPAGLLASAQYAVHVASRLIALRKERAAALEQQRLRAQEHQAALVALGQVLLAKATDKRMEPLRGKVAAVQDERAKVERADQGMVKTREGNQRALSLLQSEAEHLKEQLAPYLTAEKDALAAQRKAEEEVRRAQAMQKRVEIELRALESAASADEKRIDALNAQLEQREAAVQMLTSALALATEGLGAARRDLALKRGALDVNEEKQKRLEAENRTRELEAEGQQKAANGALSAALCELSEAARKQKLDALAPDQASQAQASERALEAAGIGVLRFDRALKLYDRKAALRGLALIAGVVVLAIVAMILRR